MKRMEDFDASEVIPKALAFMSKAKQQDKPFFVWLNTTRMHLYTHVPQKWRHAAAKYTHDQDLHGDGMMQHDHDIGLVLTWLRENGLDKNTVVWYSTDNGPEHSSWPFGGTTPFRGEKMTTYEGGVRVPSLLRWPAAIKPNQIRASSGRPEEGSDEGEWHVFAIAARCLSAHTERVDDAASTLHALRHFALILGS